MTRMWAIQQQAWGGLEQLRQVEVDRPVPLPTEVLVRVKAVSKPIPAYPRPDATTTRSTRIERPPPRS